MPRWTKDEIDILFSKSNKTSNEKIQELIPNHTWKSINQKCFELGIKRGRFHKYKLKNRDLKFEDLPKQTQQLLVGSLLGDGYILKQGRNYFFGETHGFKQSSYVKWKGNMLSAFEPTYTNCFTTVKTPSHPIFEFLHKKFYGESTRKNRIPEDLIKKLDLFGFLIWYLDDGNISRPCITSKCFNFSDLDHTANQLNKNLKLTLKAKQEKNYNTLVLFAENRDKLFPKWNNIIKENKVPECLHYKLKTNNK